MAEYQEMKDNSDWYYANLDALLPKYSGQYVAIGGRSRDRRRSGWRRVDGVDG